VAAYREQSDPMAREFGELFLRNPKALEQQMGRELCGCAVPTNSRPSLESGVQRMGLVIS
jgi:hypothetical protein